MDALALFRTSRKLSLVRYSAETTLTQVLLGLVNIFQSSLSNITALTSLVFLMPKPPSHLERQTLSTAIKGVVDWY